MKTDATVVFLAAGIGSRYGGLKQLDSFGPNKETLIDYNIYDAKKAGFNHFVFVIKREIEQAFKEKVLAKWQGVINYKIVFQENNFNPINIKINRKKPLGTGHALYCAKDVIYSDYFITCNADDLYGYNAFKEAYNWIISHNNRVAYGLVAYRLDKTLSRYGAVNRGICIIEDNYIKEIHEILKIENIPYGVLAKEIQKASDFKVIMQNNWAKIDKETLLKTLKKAKYTPRGYDVNGMLSILEDSTRVSLSLYILHRSIFTDIERLFTEFLQKLGDDPKKEFFLPDAINFSKNVKDILMEFIPTNSIWQGVTYKEDASKVRAYIKERIKRGEYKKLFNKQNTTILKIPQ